MADPDYLCSTLADKIPILHSCLANISEWPDPVPNARLQLGFLGILIDFEIPLYEHSPMLDSSSTFTITPDSADTTIPTSPLSPPRITSSAPVGSWSELLNGLDDLNDIYVLYERALLGKPVAIYGCSPQICSAFISLLLDLIRPVPYTYRVREYVTIHSCPEDIDIPGIIGFTNPFLVQTTQNNAFVCVVTSKSKRTKSQNASSLNSWTRFVWRRPAEDSGHFSHHSHVEEDGIRHQIRHTNKRFVKSRFIAPDRKFLAKLEHSLQDSHDDVINDELRLHFAELTSKILAPISYNFTTKHPSSSELATSLPPHLIFDKESFFLQLTPGFRERLRNKVRRPSQGDDINDDIHITDSGDIFHKEPESKGLIYHTLDRISSRASLLTSNVARIATSSETSQLDFYRQFIASENCNQWLTLLGVS